VKRPWSSTKMGNRERGPALALGLVADPAAVAVVSAVTRPHRRPPGAGGH
jgi:hypothetical protein